MLHRFPQKQVRNRTRDVSHHVLAPLRSSSTRPIGAVESGELLQDQLADPAGVGLAAHLLHDRADEGAGGGDLAVRILSATSRFDPPAA
jgi:hypothetical protein